MKSLRANPSAPRKAPAPLLRAPDLPATPLQPTPGLQRLSQPAQPARGAGHHWPKREPRMQRPKSSQLGDGLLASSPARGSLQLETPRPLVRQYSTAAKVKASALLPRSRLAGCCLHLFASPFCLTFAPGCAPTALAALLTFSRYFARFFSLFFHCLSNCFSHLSLICCSLYCSLVARSAQ